MQLSLSELLQQSPQQSTPTYLYLIHAKEEYSPLISLAIEYIKNHLPQPLNNHRFNNIERSFNFEELKNIMQSGSLFEEANYIELNYKNKPLLEHQQQLQLILSHSGLINFILITTNELTKKELSNDWVKTIDNAGMVIKIINSDLSNVVEYQLGLAQLSIERPALALLLELNQDNPSQLCQEISKLCLTYPAKTKLKIEDIKSDSGDNSNYNIYQLSNAYLNARTNTAIKILEHLYQTVEDTLLVVWMIGEDLRKLLKYKAKAKQGMKSAQIWQELRLWGDSIKGLEVAHKRLNYTQVAHLFNQLTLVDNIIKGVVAGDFRLELRQIVRQMCNNK